MTTPTVEVETLSPELRAQIRAFDQQWIELLTGTARADRAAVEAALVRIYLHRGLAPPAHVVWVDSPVAVGYLTEQSRLKDLNVGFVDVSFGPRLALAPELLPGVTIKPYVVGGNT